MRGLRLRSRPHWMGFFAALFGFVLFCAFLKLLHELETFDLKENLRTSFDIQKKKEKEEISSRPKPKPKKQNQSQESLKPQLNADFLSSGMDLGVDLAHFSNRGSGLLSSEEDTVMTEDVVDEVPQVSFRGQPQYPEKALKENLDGYVTVNILVNQSGQVEQVRLVESEPTGVFETAALDSVKQWVFEPARFQGRDVSVWVQQKIKFQVN